MENLTPSQRLRAAGLHPKKGWGQNFLHDSSMTTAIAQAAIEETPASCPILEIGAGLGDLTEKLLATGRKVVAIERDRDLVPILESRFAGENLQVIEGNALTFELEDGPWVVVGNLPYHISSRLIFQFLPQRDRWLQMTIMLQKELALRAGAAAPGEPGWSSFSAQIARLCDVGWILDVPPGVFTPPPKVNSAVVRLRPKKVIEEIDSPAYERCLRTVFGKRRKTLRNNLKPLFRDEPELLEACCADLSIDPQRRGETLSLAELAGLAHAISDRRPTSRR
ncbi:MAG: 16S rRNA (adenine(1518)-N(6)/adenine(1519)-N(6))-dimethyltransferase RsmA [Myxococcota bacterium]|nr:16S rRNA (adenine(1518)-N(6)/adenine(1519)-N(6))-dimethyltransferase RsmA [Myxococcota bacterium]